MSGPDGEKRRLRRLAAERAAALGPEYLRQAGETAAKRLTALPEYRAARAVLAFAGTDREMDTGPLLERVLADGKILALPLCTGPGVMEARQVTDLACLRPGRYGILEPPADAPPLPPEALDLLVVPCAACDRDGNRLGRGGGYYDRYLAVYGGPAVMLCPEALVLDRVPLAPHDRPVPLIVTEAGVWRAGEHREVTVMEVSKMDYLGIRANFAAADAVRDAGLTAPADVDRFVDIPYGPHGRWNLLDVYRPRAAGDAPLPVIVSVHGGGWVYGDKDLYQYYCMDLARRGFAVVNFSYRLAPEDPFPAAVEDVNAAFAWTADHAGDYHMDMDRLFVVGDSAGGQLACQYIAMLTDPAFGALYDFALPDVHVRAAALNCGHYQFETPADAASVQGVMAAYFGERVLACLPLVDALAHIGPAFPPTFVMTAYYDFLKDQALLLTETLRRQGVPCRYRLYGDENTPHLAHVFHLNIRLPEADACNREECDFFLSIR